MYKQFVVTIIGVKLCRCRGTQVSVTRRRTTLCEHHWRRWAANTVSCDSRTSRGHCVASGRRTTWS